MLRISYVLTLALLMTNCVSMSSLQSARTLKVDEWSAAVGVGTQSLSFNKKSTDATTNEVTEALEELSALMMDTAFRYAPIDNLDFGLKLTLPGGTTFDAKYMLMGAGDHLAVSVGLGYGSFNMTSESGTTETEYTVSDIIIPVYLSYDVNPSLGLHLTPRFQIRSTSYTTTGSSEETSSSNIIGMTFGANYQWFMAEYGYFMDPSNSDVGFQQMMIGFWTAWDDIKR